MRREEISNFIKDCDSCLAKAESGEQISQDEAMKAVFATGITHVAQSVAPYMDSFRTLSSIIKATKVV